MSPIIPLILCYHRVLPLEKFPPGYYEGMRISSDSFRKQISLLKSFCEFVDGSEALKYLSGSIKAPSEKIPTLLTFDDGYYDFYEYSWPIIEENHLPVVVFVSTEIISNNLLFWWDKLFFNVRKYYGPYLSESLEDIAEKWKYCGRHERKKKFWETVFQEEDIPEQIKKDHRVMNWDVIRYLSGKNVEFGAHGVGHKILSQLDIERARYEIRESKRSLEENLLKECRFFAYPNGSEQDFTESHFRELDDFGYVAAFSLCDGFMRGDDKYRHYSIPRIDISSLSQEKIVALLTNYRDRLATYFSSII